MADIDRVDARKQSRRRLLRTAGAGAAAAALASRLGGLPGAVPGVAAQEAPTLDSLLFFRYAEVVLLLQPEDPSAFDPEATLSPEALQRLRAVLAGPSLVTGFNVIGIAPGGDPFAPDPFQGPRGRRTLIPLQPAPRVDPVPDQPPIGPAPGSPLAGSTTSTSTLAQEIDATPLQTTGLPLLGPSLAGSNVYPVAPGTAVTPIPTTGVLQTLSLAGWFPDPRAASAQERFDAVRIVGQVVNTLNAYIATSPPLRLDGFTLQAASPNWLAMPFPWAFCGSPSGRPEVANAGVPFERRFFGGDVAATLQQMAGVAGPPETLGAGVTVAVFDTWPMAHPAPGAPPRATAIGALDGINAFRARNRGARAAAGLNRLDEIASGVVDPTLVYDYTIEYQSADGSAQRDPAGAFQRPYSMPDHGLFVADLINQVAPAARIVIYRVLNDWGVGDMDSVARAVSHASICFPGPVVLNLSLGFAPQLRAIAELMARPEFYWREPVAWLQYLTTLDGDRRPREELAARDSLLTLKALEAIFSVKAGGSRSLPVAAAGNDSARAQGAPRIVGPRLPAAFAGVLGVAAVAENGRFASYSNDPDFGLGDQGVSAYGGEVEPLSSPPTTTLRDYGLTAAYISSPLPLGSSNVNTLGLARWAGTSFATPIVAGLAAALWGSLGGSTPPIRVMERLASNPVTGTTGGVLPLFQRDAVLVRP